MAGHSKWANIQHRKSRQDAKKGKEFTKAAKEIILAAKNGGDPASNARLRTAIAAAKVVNLPKDKIDAAIRKGTGEDAGGDLFEIAYEGYGPGGVAILVQVASDNKNRIVAEVRHILSRNGGAMGEAGSVAWMFDNKGMLTFDAEKYSEEQIMEIALEHGAEDVSAEDGIIEVIVSPSDFEAVRQAFEDAGIECQTAELTMLPQNTVEVDAENGRKLLKLLDALEDNDDVQNVYSNFDLPDEVMAEL